VNQPAIASLPRAADDTVQRAPRERLSRALLVILIAVIAVGFAKNFYLRAWLGTRPLTTIAWAHGYAMTAWLVLCGLQYTLVALGRTDQHRRLGRWTALMAVLLVVLGIVTIVAAAQRNHAAGSLMQLGVAFVAYDGLSLLLFAALVGLAIRARRRPALHRRLMLMAMVALLPPAFGRLVAYVYTRHVEIVVLTLMAATVGLVILQELRRHGRVHLAVWVPAAAILLIDTLTYLAQVLG
jgi:hypothetical protein